MKYCYILCFCILCSFSSFAEDRINFFEVRAGTWIPMGGIKNTFNTSPSLGLYLGVPIHEYNTAVDVYFQLIYTGKSQPFDFYYSKDSYDTTDTECIVNLGLRLRKQVTLFSHVYLTHYWGIGINMIPTDLEDKYDEEEGTRTVHLLETLNLTFGLNLRYKEIGCFIEYQYSPYAMKSRVINGFGCSAVNIGINLSY